MIDTYVTKRIYREKNKYFARRYSRRGVDFIDFLESKRKKLSIIKEDPLSKTIGICEGPSDLAENHDKYVYK